MLAGLLIGNAIGSRPPRRPVNNTGRDKYAEKRDKDMAREAEDREREARRAALLAEQAANAPQAITIPSGISPGMLFRVQYLGQEYSLTCPPGLGPGATMHVTFPKPSPTVVVAANPVVTPPPVVAAALSEDLSSLGKTILVSANSQSENLPMCMCIANHIAESAEAEAHQILSLYEGETVLLVQGSLEQGLAQPYQGLLLLFLQKNKGGYARGSLTNKKPHARANRRLRLGSASRWFW